MPDKTNQPTPANSSQLPVHTQAELEAVQAMAARMTSEQASTNKNHFAEPQLDIGGLHDVIAKSNISPATNQPPAAPAPPPTMPATNQAPANSPALPPAAEVGPILPQPPQVNDPSAVVTGVFTTVGLPLTMPDQAAPGSTGDLGFAPLESPADATSQLQASADQILRAFELNTQSQLSLYDRMLELLDEQNRKLSDLDRKTSELSGQIKSLKNP